MRGRSRQFPVGQGLSRGFSLLEIVIVLALGALLVGGAVAVMMVSDSERVMKGAMSHVESMAKRARTTAILQQTPYALEFTFGQVRMMPLSEALMPVAPTPARGKAGKDAEPPRTNGSRFEPIHAQWAWEENLTFSVRRWAATEWLPVGEKSRHLWRFDPDGICEPLGVRVQVDKSWMEVEFHPLTGGIRNTMMEANK